MRMPMQRRFLCFFVAILITCGSAVVQKGSADQYVGTCACDYDGEGLSCHAVQTVRGESLDALARICANEVGPRASILQDSVRTEKDISTESEQDASNDQQPDPSRRPQR